MGAKLVSFESILNRRLNLNSVENTNDLEYCAYNQNVAIPVEFDWQNKRLEYLLKKLEETINEEINELIRWGCGVFKEENITYFIDKIEFYDTSTWQFRSGDGIIIYIKAKIND